jgi:hypothetical protein
MQLSKAVDGIGEWAGLGVEVQEEDVSYVSMGMGLAAIGAAIADHGKLFELCKGCALDDGGVAHGANFLIITTLWAEDALAIDTLILIHDIRTYGATVPIRVPAWKLLLESGAAEVIGEAGHTGGFRQAEIGMDMAEKISPSSAVIRGLPVGGDGAGEAAVVIRDERGRRSPILAHDSKAGGAIRCDDASADGSESDGRQNGDDDDHDQQFGQGETGFQAGVSMGLGFHGFDANWWSENADPLF